MQTYITFIFFLFVGSLILSFLYAIVKNKKFLTLRDEVSEKNRQIKTLEEQEKSLQAEVISLQVKLKSSLEDDITSLPSWQLFEDKLKQALNESERYQLTMAVLCIDIDDFKVVNEVLGYEAGDNLLKEAATRLKNCTRKVDGIARFTKDTFILFLTQLNKFEAAALVAQRILQVIRKPFHIHDDELFITCCIGIATYPADGKDASSILRNAEHALRLAREKGKNSYQFYQQGLQVKSQRELILHASLSRETMFQDFTISYQPIYNSETKIILGMDVILKWQHPQLGLVTSAELFAYAEKHRKANLISEWLLQNACKQFMYWRKFSFAPQYLALSITIEQLENIHFIYRISQMLQEVSFKPEWLLLEIKGSARYFSYEVLEKAFNMLSYLGIKIAVNNFGSEPLALTQLQKINASYIKISSALTKNIIVDKNERRLFQAIVLFAKKLNIAVIAEGVDNEELANSLKNLGCLYLQGVYLHAPLSIKEIEEELLIMQP